MLSLMSLMSELQVIVEPFGKDAMLELTVQLYEECDQYGARILKRFVETRNVKHIVQDINLHRKKDLSNVHV